MLTLPDAFIIGFAAGAALAVLLYGIWRVCIADAGRGY